MEIVRIDENLDCLVCKDLDGKEHFIHRSLVDDVVTESNVDVENGIIHVDMYFKLKSPQYSVNVKITKEK